MPGAHRNDDKRFCNAKTVVVGQSSVFVNNKLWAVEGDVDTHCFEGELEAIYGPKNVYIENKLVICAIGDAARSDKPIPTCCGPLCPEHPAPSTWPRDKSNNVKVYHGVRGGMARRVNEL